MRARKQKWLSGLASACIVLSASSVAWAQFEAGGFGGYQSFSQNNRLGRYDHDPSATSLVPGPVIGARFSYVPIRYLGAEMQLSVVPTATRDDKTTATVVDARAHLIATLPIGRFRPFLLVGATAANLIPADPTYLRTMTELNVHGGGGLRFDVSPRWGVRADVLIAAVPRDDSPGIAFEPTFLLGVYGNFLWPPEPPPPFDKDKDDITDDRDDCPDKAGEVRFAGCPDPNAPADDSGDDDSDAGADDDGGDAGASDGDGGVDDGGGTGASDANVGNVADGGVDATTPANAAATKESGK